MRGKKRWKGEGKNGGSDRRVRGRKIKGWKSKERNVERMNG